MNRKHVFTVRTSEVVKGYKNLLTHVMYGIVHKIIVSGVSGGVLDIGGNLRDSTQFYSTGICSMRFGDGVQLPTFQDYRLANEKEIASITTVIGRVNNELVRVSVTGTPTADRVEMGIFQTIYITGNYTFMYCRKVGSFPVNYPYVHYFNFKKPLTYNVAHAFFNLLRYENVNGAIDLGGNFFAPRTAGANLISGNAYLIASEEEVSFDNLLYTLPNFITLTSSIYGLGNQYLQLAIITGYIIPSTDLTIRALGVVSRWYDSVGNTRNVLTAVLIPSSPISCPANKLSMFQIRFVGV